MLLWFVNKIDLITSRDKHTKCARFFLCNFLNRKEVNNQTILNLNLRYNYHRFLGSKKLQNILKLYFNKTDRMPMPHIVAKTEIISILAKSKF